MASLIARASPRQGQGLGGGASRGPGAFPRDPAGLRDPVQREESTTAKEQKVGSELSRAIVPNCRAAVSLSLAARPVCMFCELLLKRRVLTAAEYPI